MFRFCFRNSIVLLTVTVDVFDMFPAKFHSRVELIQKLKTGTIVLYCFTLFYEYVCYAVAVNFVV